MCFTDREKLVRLKYGYTVPIMPQKCKTEEQINKIMEDNPKRAIFV